MLTSDMPPNDFRRIALSVPHAKEVLRVGRPTTTSGARHSRAWMVLPIRFGVIKLTPDQQVSFVAQSPGGVRASYPGDWGNLATLLLGWKEPAGRLLRN